MLLHHGDQHFFGQTQVVGVEAAANGRRLLDQVGDLVQQAGIIGDAPSDLGGQRRPLGL